MENRVTRKLNNKGLSLIELIVVVLIMGIVATALILNISTIFGRSAEDAANKISKILDRARIEAMNRVDGKVFVRIYYSTADSGYRASIMYTTADVNNPTTGDTESIGGVSITTYTAGNDAQGYSNETNYTDLYFDKSSGAFVNAPTGVAAGKAVDYIAVAAHNKTAKVIVVWETGRNYVVTD